MTETTRATASHAPAPLAGRWRSVLGKLANTLVVGAAALIVIGVLVVAVGPRLLPYQTQVVLSGSMEPTIPVGALVVLQPVAAEDLQVGDVITFQRPDATAQLITHRIVDIDEIQGARTFGTQGDANGEPDVWRIAARGSGWRYEFSVPYVGYAIGAAQSPLGRIVLVVIPAALVAGVLLIEIWRPKKPATGSVSQ